MLTIFKEIFERKIINILHMQIIIKSNKINNKGENVIKKKRKS